ncbi:6060_t:CDS:1 [Cetraspora pellucida]|uniref:6060_t:CDS:1 n=1 Tax=Cetraspora pellucida TaxID=1433469 RepID=A0ACA9MAF8_9GLOM|nr:6060_t:CDS:1 [Cetraspora pellucida]
MSNLSQNPNWFHSDFLKTFVLNILKNSKDVKIRSVNIEQYPCQSCNREIFSFQPIILLSCGHAFHAYCANFNLDPAICPKCPVQSEVRVEEIEITSKHKKKMNQFKDSQKFKKLVNELLNVQNITQPRLESNTSLTQLHIESNARIDFNNLNQEIFITEENNKKLNHEVLKHYYDLGEALSRLYDYYYSLSHNMHKSRQQINQEFKRQLNINTLDMALRKRKERSEKIYSLFSCFNINEDRFKGKAMISRIKTFSVSTISSIS